MNIPIFPAPDNFTPPARTPWGGCEIVKFKKALGIKCKDVVGESWEISDHKSFPNKIENGELPRLPFLVKLVNSGSWKKFRKNFARAGENNHEFLTRLLESGDSELKRVSGEMLGKNLSVQVHPPAGYCADASPKTEGWYILSAEEGSGIYIGLKDGVTKDQMERALRTGENVTVYLNFVEVKEGDVFYIPAGTPHAIGAGILLYEPQQKSETTYRFYDYGRPRELHVRDAIDATNWGELRGGAFVESVRRTPKTPSPPVGEGRGEGEESILINEKEFVLSRIDLKSGETHSADCGGRVHGLTVIKGRVEIIGRDGQAFGPAKQGQSVIIPAGMGFYALKPFKSVHAAVLKISNNFD